MFLEVIEFGNQELDRLAKVEKKNNYKVETWSRRCNCELVRSFKIKIYKERSLKLTKCEDYLYTKLKVD
jgi:hypothetical protein